MAIEFSRETSVRKVCPDPASNDSHVKLKVLDRISFIDAKAQYQEYPFSFNNTPTADRVTHSEKAGDDLDVERIDKLSIIDAKDHFQESLFSFLRYQQGVHLKTHRTKVYALNSDGTKDDGTWIEVERVDQISFVDPKAQYQEYIYELKWPDLTDPEWDYRDLTPVVTDYDKTSINPPWRLDPFQNIVDSSFGNWDYLVIEYHWDTDADLDIRHNVLSPVPGLLGWSESETAGDVAFWGGDNTGQFPSSESVYFDLKKAKAYKSDLIMELRAYWYDPASPASTTAVTSPVTIKITLSKGGGVSLLQNLWTPFGQDRVKTETILITEVTDFKDFYPGVSSEWPGQLLGTLRFSPNSGKWKLT